MFTGMYPFAHGHYGNNNDVQLDDDLPSLASEFHGRGYNTGLFGKDHLPEQLTAPFEVKQTISKEYQEYLNEKGLSDEACHTPKRDMQFDSWTSEIPKRHSTEVWTAERAIDFIKKQNPEGNDFFCRVSFERPHAPHSPDPQTEKLVDPDRVPLPWEDYELFEQTRIQPRPGREDYWKLGGWDNPGIYQRAVARYYSLIGLIDEQIGRILSALEEQGLAEDTLIVFCPDHGDFGGDYGQLGKNVPVYEQLYRVPIIWCDPARPQDHGKVIEGLWETIDLFPSLMQRLGWEIPARVQGQSFLRAIDGWRPVGKPYVFMETNMCRMIRTREHKLAFHLDRPDDGQLFDMLPRPDELHNRWHDPGYRETREKLLRELMAHLMRYNQPRSFLTDWEPLYPTRYNKARGWAEQKPNQDV
jgi:arylsulfatase A-like enzyme